jgi:16S rRNA (cytidine1402-2'-O)-methyltransferase
MNLSYIIFNNLVFVDMGNMRNFGILYVVATPIGNLKDITFRAVEILKSVDRIAAEDTRHTALLLKHYSIQKPIFSLHDFNERDRVSQVLDYLRKNESIALVSDAGTPLVSDPGFQLVKSLKDQGIQIVPIPGPCAAIAALSIAGLPTDKFTFEGFLPAKSEVRRHRLHELRYETRTLIFYESPRRVLSILKDLLEIMGDARNGVIARELTKMHESIVRGSLASLIQYFEEHHDELRGEFVVLIEGSSKQPGEAQQARSAEVLDILLNALPIKQAAMLASQITGERKNTLYELALKKKNQPISI